jgi:alkylated DNA repair dioxygenase AlkB
MEWASDLLKERVAAGAAPAGVFRNEALEHAVDMMKSEHARLDAQLTEDFNTVLKGNAIYIQRFACEKNDVKLYNALKSELSSTGGEIREGVVSWSKHQKYENPEGASELFTKLVAMLSEYFDVDVFATRLNIYASGNDWKPYHHDSHAYGAKGVREDFTAGLSLGATRALNFLHVPTRKIFSFPQFNGDVFAFSNEVNTRFQHGVPKASADCGERLSIIVWGKRRSLNCRNGGASVTTPLSMPRDVLRNVSGIVAAVHRLVARDENVAPTKDETAGNPSLCCKKKKNRLQ